MPRRSPPPLSTPLRHPANPPDFLRDDRDQRLGRRAQRPLRMAHANQMPHDARRNDGMHPQPPLFHGAQHHDARQHGGKARRLHELDDGAEDVDLELRRKGDVLRLRRRVQHHAQAMPLGRQHQFQSWQLCHLYRCREFGAVRGAGHQHHFLVVQRLHMQRRAAALAMHHGRVKLAGGNEIDQRGTEAVRHGYLYVRIARIEARQRSHQHALRLGRDHAKRDAAGHLLLALHHLLPRTGDVAHDGEKQAVHHATRSGRHHAMRDAIEQLLPEFFFQPRDLHAERRLHDIQALGRARDRAVLEQRDEVLDLFEVHGWIGINATVIPASILVMNPRRLAMRRTTAFNQLLRIHTHPREDPNSSLQMMH
ncbi:hypothetical protein CBM2606_A110085 [Cupriavidus taiwanensis]|nr:hypothetical protein CBM2606_A110085 [Cupriavidus taiwanensis]